MSKKDNISKLIAAGAAIAATAVVANKVKKDVDEKRIKADVATLNFSVNDNRSAYIVGGGLGSLAAAAYLVRDCGMKGENLHIYEGQKVLGGSNDGAGSVENGFVCRGGRMLNEETYENFWELFSTIPSIEFKDKSVTEEILNFDHLHPTHAQARLVNKDGEILDVKSMGFNSKDRLLLGRLMITPEKSMDNMTIQQWFEDSPHFFETNFWYMWQTTFAFQRWSSLFEFRRYMDRMIFEFSRIETLEGVTRTPYNQYESVILPIKAYLDSFNVDFVTDAVVTDIDFAEGGQITANKLYVTQDGEEKIIEIDEDDICIMTNGCMTDNATLGDYKTAPIFAPENPISGELWERVSKKKSGLGNPEPFFSKPQETNWESFTVTSKGNKLLNMIEKFSGNIPGSGALMTFKESGWLMSIVVAAQPHFKNQPIDTTIFWGYGLYTDKEGDYVKKPMRECTGEELLEELLYQLHFEENIEEIKADVINVIPCMMPYVDAQFQPRAMSDRPHVVPKGSTNFAMISQFVEIPEDMVFTEEYSVRAARIAVYKLMGMDMSKICSVTPYKKDPKVLKKALQTAYR